MALSSALARKFETPYGSSVMRGQRGQELVADSGLVRAARYIQRGEPSPDARELHRRGGRQAEEFYRERWRHDKVVRSTHGVNCTGSCSWRVFVKDGIITWETQAVDYPSIGPSSPEYEPRGCPGPGAQLETTRTTALFPTWRVICPPT